MATQQLYTPDDLVAALVADFQARQISAVVEVGEWSPEVRRGEPRVIIDFGDGEIGEPVANLDGPGAVSTVPGSTTSVARQLLDDEQLFILWIHAPGVGSGEGAGVAGRRATDLLKRQTMAAIRRNQAAPFRKRARVTWPSKDDPQVAAYPAFVRGTLARVEVALPSAILDDALDTGTTVEADFTDQVVIDGTPSPGESSSETIP